MINSKNSKESDYCIMRILDTRLCFRKIKELSVNRNLSKPFKSFMLEVQHFKETSPLICWRTFVMKEFPALVLFINYDVDFDIERVKSIFGRR